MTQFVEKKFEVKTQGMMKEKRKYSTEYFLILKYLRPCSLSALGPKYFRHFWKNIFKVCVPY